MLNLMSHWFFFLYTLAMLLVVLAVGGFVLGWAFRKGWNRAVSRPIASIEIRRPE